MPARFYVTTPIYYVSDVPHLGHAYTTVVADALARFHRLRGDQTRFLTGTDDHGQKIERLAAEKGIGPRAFADNFADAYRATWQKLGISNDDFIRTTDADHEAVVKDLWKKLEASGDLYLADYEGWYCVPCEQFYTEKELGEGSTCPVHRRPVEKVKEQSYYFRLSKYRQALLDHYTKHPDFVRPRERMNEVRAFVEGDLRDLSVSRTTFKWGVPVPGHEGHVVYVWIDALSNYYSATQRLQDVDYWGKDVQIVHLMGKEISRFHAVIWPAMLMSAGLRLPDTVFCHGWWTVDGEKMSKTLGNVVDPLKLAADVGVDAFRYFVLREVPLGADGDFSHEALLTRYNAELANDLGNLLNRTLGMVTKYFGDAGISERAPQADSSTFNIAGLLVQYGRLMEDLAPSRALEEIWQWVRLGNTYIDKQAPWKPESPRVQILGNLLELCRVLAHVLSPFMPERSRAMLDQLGLSETFHLPTWDGTRAFVPTKATPLFPRVDDDRKAELLAKWRPKPPAAVSDRSSASSRPSGAGQVTYEEFQRFDFRVAKVLAAEPVPKAKKLLKLTIDLGTEQRQVVAGIADTYAPDEVVGRSVVFLANLKPASIRGVLSEGMILAAGEETVVALSALDRAAEPGTKIR
jgi:methionyl-tRNA synthetase